MSEDELRELLAKVQAGEVKPEEAAALLGERSESPPSAQAEPFPSTGARSDDDEAASFAGVRLVRIRATANKTRVVGDPAVQTVRVEGPHRVRLEGDQLTVENDFVGDGVSMGADDLRTTIRMVGRHPKSVRINGMEGLRTLAGGFEPGKTLEIRVNPTMPLDFDCDAGKIEIIGVESALSGRINAGKADIDGFDGPLNLSVNAGKLVARGRLSGGESSIDVNVGKADVTLEPGSNVRIVQTATMGSADIEDNVVGTGEGSLRVTCSLGSVRVSSAHGSTKTVVR